MVDKEMVEIVDERRPQRFKAIITKEKARKSGTDVWLQRMFGGSLLGLVRYVLTGRKLAKAEVAEFKKDH